MRGLLRSAGAFCFFGRVGDAMAAYWWPMVARDIGALIGQGRRLEPEHAAYLIGSACEALVREQRGVLVTPAHLQIASDGGIAIGDVDFERLVAAAATGYAAPELTRRGTEPPSRFREVRVIEERPDYKRMVIHEWNPPTFHRSVERDFGGANVFALGCMLWELLSGTRLFQGANEIESMALAREARVPSLVDVPHSLAAIVRKALEKDVGDRYQTPRELGRALADFLVVRAQN